MTIRTRVSLETVLEDELRKPFIEQKASLLGALAGATTQESQTSLRDHVEDLFLNHCGMTETEAGALAKLMVAERMTEKREEATDEESQAWAERAALLRTIMAQGLQAQVRTYFRAAAIGAMEGFSRDGQTLLTAQEMDGIAIPASAPALLENRAVGGGS